MGATVPQFPAEYLTDAVLWMPDQNADDPVFKNPALPYGCTDYTQADLSIDEINALSRDPLSLDNITFANRNGGTDVRTALDAAKNKLNWFGAYYAVKAYAPLDYFDAIRLAISSGYPEKRSVSLGTPWWPEFEVVGANGLLQSPTGTNAFNPAGLPWHNHKICGWKTIGGTPFLISKSWQGPNYGDKGFVYFSRPLINSIMAIKGTCAFTVTQTIPTVVETIDMAWVPWLLSLIGYRY